MSQILDFENKYSANLLLEWEEDVEDEDIRDSVFLMTTVVVLVLGPIPVKMSGGTLSYWELSRWILAGSGGGISSAVLEKVKIDQF